MHLWKHSKKYSWNTFNLRSRNGRNKREKWQLRTKETKACLRVFLATSHRKVDDCLNLRTFSIYVISHLEESGFRIQHFKQRKQSLQSPPLHVGLIPPSQDGILLNAKDIHELPHRICLLLDITTFPRNLRYLISLCLELGHLDTPQWKETWKVNIWQKITELCPCPLKKSIVCWEIIWGKEQRITIG